MCLQPDTGKRTHPCSRSRFGFRMITSVNVRFTYTHDDVMDLIITTGTTTFGPNADPTCSYAAVLPPLQTAAGSTGAHLFERRALGGVQAEACMHGERKGERYDARQIRELRVRQILAVPLVGGRAPSRGCGCGQPQRLRGFGDGVRGTCPACAVTTARPSVDGGALRRRGCRSPSPCCWGHPLHCPACMHACIRKHIV